MKYYHRKGLALSSKVLSQALRLGQFSMVHTFGSMTYHTATVYRLGSGENVTLFADSVSKAELQAIGFVRANWHLIEYPCLLTEKH